MTARENLYRIKMLLVTGNITYEQAKEEAKPFIDELNEKGQEIAKKYGRKFVKTTFSQQMR